MKIRCPIASCGCENETPVSTCESCDADLRAYACALRYSDMCFNRGLHFVHEGDFQSAKREFQACLSYCPRDDEAQLLLGKTYWAAGEKRNARRAWKMLIANTSNASMAEKAELCLKAAANRSRQRKNEIDIPNTELPKDTLSVLKEKNTKI